MPRYKLAAVLNMLADPWGVRCQPAASAWADLPCVLLGPLTASMSKIHVQAEMYIQALNPAPAWAASQTLVRGGPQTRLR